MKSRALCTRLKEESPGDRKKRSKEKRNRITVRVGRAGSPYQMASGHRNSVTVTL